MNSKIGWYHDTRKQQLQRTLAPQNMKLFVWQGAESESGKVRVGNCESETGGPESVKFESEIMKGLNRQLGRQDSKTGRAVNKPMQSVARHDQKD